MIASVVNDLTTELRMRDAVGCELVLDVAPDVPSALIGDAVKIKRILNHLITNGLKFTPKGGVYVRVYTMERPYGVNLCMEISDTGLGMTADELEHIFDSFYQHNSGRTRGTGGLGLGLTIVHGLVRAMGGFMTIDSEIGGGTTVSVSIPQKVADAETIATNHETMLAQYTAVSDAVLRCFGAPESESDGGDEVLEFAPEGEPSPEDEILEFAPEGD